MKKHLVITLITLSIIFLLAWSPWITKNYAEERVKANFGHKWEGVSDGCGFNCQNCGVYRSNKVLFGYNVIILYSCGMKAYPPIDIPDWQDKMFVSPLGSVHTISHRSNLD